MDLCRSPLRRDRSTALSRWLNRGRRRRFRRCRRQADGAPLVSGVERLKDRTLLSVAIGRNFTGSTFGEPLPGSLFVAPDTSGAVGPDHFVEMVNGRYAVYGKSSGAVVDESSLNQFWTDAGAAWTSNTTDPRVVYDHADEKWFAAAVDNTENPNRFLIAVSESPDPTAGWTGFSIDSDSSDERWADSPTLGLDADGVYLAAVMRDIAGGLFQLDDVTVVSIPKAGLLAGTPTVENRTVFESAGIATLGFAIQPAVDFGGSDGRAALLAVDPNSSRLLHRTSVLGAAGPGATLSATTDIDIDPAGSPPPAEQPNISDRIDAGDKRFGGSVVEVGTSLWAAHAIFVDRRAAIRWYEIDETTHAVLQSGTIADPELAFYYPSIAANEFGQVVIGFSGSGPDRFVSSYAAAGTTVAGVTTFDAPLVLQAGDSTYRRIDGTGRNRWGDYSATTVDPVDPHRFWTIQEWASDKDVWSTQVTELIFTFDDPDDQIVEANPAAVDSTVTGFEIDPGEDVDVFEFTVAAGRRIAVAVHTQESDLDPLLRLFDAAGTALASDDDGGPGADSLLIHTFETAGTYYIGVSGAENRGYDAITGEGDVPGSTGSYELQIIDTDLVVTADDPGGNGRDNGLADTFRLVRSGGELEVYIDGNVSRRVPVALVNSITVSGSGDDDQLMVDAGVGNVFPAGGITFIGSGHQSAGDSLRVIAGGTGDGSYDPSATTTGSGTATIVGAGTVELTGVESVTVGGFAGFTLTTPGSADVVTIDSPATGRSRIAGTSDGTAFAPLTFFDVTDLTIDAATNDGASPGDLVTMNAALVATGLAGFNIETGDGEDSIAVIPSTAGGAAVNIDGGAPPDPTAPGDALIYGGTGTISITGRGAGTITSPGFAAVIFVSTEDVRAAAAGSFEVVVDAGANGAIGDGSGDSFLLRKNAMAAGLEVHVNGSPVFAGRFADVNGVTVNGSADDDLLTIDNANGLLDLRGAIAYSGNALGAAADTDRLAITGDPGSGTAAARETYLVGGTEDAGTWIIDPDGNRGAGAAGPANGDELIVEFTGSESVDSDTPAVVFDVVLTAAADRASIENGGLLGGSPSIQVTDESGTFETFRFANKAAVRLMGQSGSDAFRLNARTNAAGLNALEIYGHLAAAVGGPPDDRGEDSFEINATTAAVTSLFGQGGSDLFSNTALGPFGSGTFALDAWAGTLNISGGESPGDFDVLDLQDRDDLTGDVVALTATELHGTGPAAVHYGEIEALFFGGSAGDDALNVLSTAAGTSYMLTGNGGDNTVTVGNETADFGSIFDGSLDEILGDILVSGEWWSGEWGQGETTHHSPLTTHSNSGADTLNIDDSGTAELDGAATIDTLADFSVPRGPFAASIIGDATVLSGFAPAAIRYLHGPMSGEINAANNQIEFLNVLASAGDDTIHVNATTAANATTLDAFTGDDAVTVHGDGLSASNTFLGGAGSDRFELNVAADLGGASLFDLTGLEIHGNGPAGQTNSRDVLEINDGGDNSRDLVFEYLDTPGDLDVRPGATGGLGSGAADFPLRVRTMETVTYNGTGPGDSVRIEGTSADDELTVAPLAVGSALVLLGGDPWDGPGDGDFFDAIPGVAGGSFGPDLLLNGLDAANGLTVDGGGSANAGDRLFVYGTNEGDLNDGTANDYFRFGPGVVLPGKGVGLAFDEVLVRDDVVRFVDDVNAPTADVLVRVNIASPSFVQAAPLATGLFVNTVADDIRAELSFNFGIRVNGGDRLQVDAPGEVNVFSDKSDPPNVTITSSDPDTGTASFGLGFSSIDSTIVTPHFSSQTVNLIGDNDDPAADQDDTFVVIGADVDSLLEPIPGAPPEFQPDADGANELFLEINGSPPIALRNVVFLNARGDDQSGSPSAPPDADMLEITPYADNTPTGWGIAVRFETGMSADASPDRGDAVVVNGVAGMPEEFIVRPSGPGTGRVVVRNQAGGSPITTIDYTGNAGILFNGNDAAADETDVLTLLGTDTGTASSSGDDAIAADFTAAGGAADPVIEARDDQGLALLYRVLNLTNIAAVDFDLLGGDDRLSVRGRTNGAGLDIDRLVVSGGPGNDLVEIDTSLGLSDFPGGLLFEGGRGDDTLLLSGSGPLDSSVFSPGPNPDGGTIVHTIAATDQTGRIDFTGLERIIDVVPSGELTVNGTNIDDSIGYSQSEIDPAWGKVAVAGFAPVHFADKQSLVLKGLAGDDEISLDNPTTPVGLTGSITVDGGDAPGGDRLVVNGVAAAVSVDPAAGTIAGASGTGGAVNVNFAAVEEFTIVAGAATRLSVSNASATGPVDYIFTPGAAVDAGTIQTPVGPISFVGFAAGSTIGLNADGLDGNDSLVVNGTAGVDEFTVASATGEITLVTSGLTRATITHGGLETLTLRGLDADDTFNVTPSPTTTIFIDGGDPIGTTPGDRINLLPPGAFAIEPGPEGDEGGLVGAGGRRVGWEHIEDVTVSGPGPALVLGTRDDDDIRIFARDSSTHAGTDGVQDFTVTVNGSFEVLFIDQPVLFVDALAGDDDVMLRTPAPNDAEWDVDVTIAGGPPSAATGGRGDVFVLETPFADTIVFTPTGPGTATLLIDEPGADSQINLAASFTVAALGFISSPGGVEHVLYDGRAGGDTLTINGTAGDDAAVISPSGIGSGSFRAGLSPAFDFTGATAVTVNGGAGGFDELTLEGTAGVDSVTSTADAITVNATGTATVGIGVDRVLVTTLAGDDDIDLDLNLSGVEKVVDAGAGDDTLDLAGTLDATVLGGTGNDAIVGSPLADFIDGGQGNDTILGLGGDDTIDGGGGNDSAVGGAGADQFFGGDGADTFVWNPGDGSDLVEGGSSDADVLVFNGAPALAEIFTLSAVGARLELLRNPGGSMDIAGVEQIDLNGLGGADTFTVNDLAQTDARGVNLDLGAGGATQSVTVNGRTVADDILITQAGGVVNLAGLRYDVNISGARAADADLLTVNGNDGNDTIKAAAGFDELIGLSLVGGDGDDLLLGGGGNDTLRGEAGNDTFVGGAGDDFIDGGAGFDTILVRGTSGDDTIDVNQAADDTLVHTVNDDVQTDVLAVLVSGEWSSGEWVEGGTTHHSPFTTHSRAAGVRTVESVRVEGLDGDDAISVTWADAVDNLVRGEWWSGEWGERETTHHSLLTTHSRVGVDVDGGPARSGDRLAVLDEGTGDLVLHRKSESDVAGSVTVGPALDEPFVVVFDGIELVEPVAADGGRVVVFEHDPFEPNEGIDSAADLGSGALDDVVSGEWWSGEWGELETTHPSPVTTHSEVDVGATIDAGLDGGGTSDRDVYRLVAPLTGTLDVRVAFEQIATLPSGRPGLPGAGDLDIELLDAAGNPVAGFGANDADDDERVRIPAVAGGTWLLRVVGAGEAINAYRLTVVGTAAPVPFDLELRESVVSGGVVSGGVVSGGVVSGGVVSGGVVSGGVVSGPDQRRHSQLTTHPSPANVTRNATPTIVFRLDDAFFLSDVPANVVESLRESGSVENSLREFGGDSRSESSTMSSTTATAGPPFDEVIPIPFRGGDLLPGYRIAIFDETAAPGGLAGRSPALLGFATATAEPGVYTFTTPALPDGRHVLSARVQMIDPADPPRTGFGAVSEPLEIVVDTQPPPVFFGTAAAATDGLAAGSDTGVSANAGTLIDRITSATTPEFFGAAEPGAVVRVYADVDQNGLVEPGDVLLGETVADSTQGRWRLPSAVDLNDPAFFARDGLRQLVVTAEDVAGNLGGPDVLRIFIDTEGPRIFDPDGAGPQQAVQLVSAGGVESTYGLFDAGTSSGPTPLTAGLVIHIRDLPGRFAPGFLYDALEQSITHDADHYRLVGQRVGGVEIGGVTVLQGPAAGGQAAAAQIVLGFAEPLPDDRYTLTVLDSLTDAAGNRLDGENGAGEANEAPSFPSGDGVPGGDFVARFIVDTRAEIGVWDQSQIVLDADGDFAFDSTAAAGADADHRGNAAFSIGLASDAIFAGRFHPAGAAAASRFDRIGAYGRSNGTFRFLLDFNNDRRIDAGESLVSNWQINGLPVAGNFDLNAANGDEIGLFDGRGWSFDTDGDNRLDATVGGNLHGAPFVGDFDGDGIDDLATHLASADRFFFSLSSAGGSFVNGNANATHTFAFGLPGVLERPFAGEFDGLGVEDFGLAGPGGTGDELEFFVFQSGDNVGMAGFAELTNGFSPAPEGMDARTTFGDSFSVPVAGNFAPPGGPTSIPAFAPIGTTSDTTPAVQWSPVGGTLYYEVHMYHVDRGRAVYVVGITETDYTHPAPLAPGRYESFVRARDSHGDPGSWTRMEFTVQAQTLGVPVLTAPAASSQVAGGAVTISWEPGRVAPDRATGYQLLVYNTALGREVAGASVSGTSHTVSLLGGALYQVFVRGMNGTQTSGWSSPLVFEAVGGLPLPAKPALLAPMLGETTATLNWTAASGAESYQVLIYDKALGRELVNTTVASATSHRFATTPGRRYQVFVRGTNTAGSSGWSGPQEFVAEAEGGESWSGGVESGEWIADCGLAIADYDQSAIRNLKSAMRPLTTHDSPLTSALDAVLAAWPEADWWSEGLVSREWWSGELEPGRVGPVSGRHAPAPTHRSALTNHSASWLERFGLVGGLFGLAAVRLGRRRKRAPSRSIRDERATVFK